MPDRNQKMENGEDEKGNLNEASSSGEHEESLHTANKGDKAQHFFMGGLTGASPPKFVSLEEIVKAANGMKNMALAHEIAVDKNFQLQKLELENDALHSRVKEIMHKAFWNLLAEQLAEDPPNYTQALVLLSEIKESLDELVLPHHTKIRESIKEVLDVDFIKQQAEKGVLDFHRYAQYVISIMSKVCAPVRDEKFRELQGQTDVIETFKGIMETLQLMRLDLANFTITMMRPNIIASSIEYEKAKFAEFMKINANGLEKTERWLLKHLDAVKANAPLVDRGNVKQITHRLLTEAYLDLLEWDFNPDAETLMLDQGRLLLLRDKTSRLTVVAATILLVINSIGAAIHAVPNGKDSMKRHIAVLLESVHSNKDLTEIMPNIILQIKTDLKKIIPEPDLSPQLEALVDAQLQELINPDHNIRCLVTVRVRQFLQRIIKSQSVAPQQVPLGLSLFQEELTEIAAQFLILVSHNRSVFGDYYQEIVARALSKDKNAEGNESGGSISTQV